MDLGQAASTSPAAEALYCARPSKKPDPDSGQTYRLSMSSMEAKIHQCFQTTLKDTTKFIIMNRPENRIRLFWT